MQKRFTFKTGKKILLQRIIFLVFLFCVHTQANAFSQNAKVSIKAKDITIRELLNKIEELTDFSFVYNVEDIINEEIKNVHFENTDIAEILDYHLNKQNLEYSFVKNHIIIKKIKNQHPNKLRKVRGIILSSKTSEPLIGATIQVKNTNIGVISNEKGEFHIEIPSNITEVTVSYIGYQTKTVPILNDLFLKISLNYSQVEMENVVVTGIFTRKANSYTGSIETINMEKIQNTGNLNLIKAIGSISPSFAILTNNEMGADPNSIPDIQIRGASSFSDMRDKYTTSPNQPLFIVDGFETSITRVIDMDINRISSITLLKDATAKAIYGAKGANGVIVIETIKPKKGKLRVYYKGDLNIQIPDLSSYNMSNAMEKLEIEKNAGIYGKSFDSPATLAIKKQKYDIIYKDILSGANTDWKRIPLRTGIGSKHSINIEGGDNSFTYNASIGYNNINGVMKDSYRNTIDGNITLAYRYKNLIFREQLNVMLTSSKDSPYGIFSDYIAMNPYWRAYERDGSIKKVLGTYNIANQQGTHHIYNPLLNSTSGYKSNDSYMNVTNNFYIEWNVFNNIKLKSRLGFSKEKGENHIFYPSNYVSINPNRMFEGVNINFISITPDDGDDYFKRGLYHIAYNNKQSLTSETSINYFKHIGKHTLFANLMYSISELSFENIGYQGQGFSDNASSIHQARSYSENASPSGYENKQRDLGFIGSINYSYDSKYLFDFNYRASASSLFGVNKRWGKFWSVGMGWNLHKEKFLINYEFLNQLKLRASIGTTGSQNFSAYQAISMYKYFSEQVYDQIVGAHLMGLPNPDLSWQRTTDKNIGFDLGLFNKLEVKFDYYNKITNNMLTPITVVTSTGFTTYQENLGETQNKGFEAQVRYRFIANPKKDIFLSLNAAIARNENKILKINNALQTINQEKDDITNKNEYPDHEANKGKLTRPKVRYAEGQSLSAIWAVRSLGIDPTTGAEIFMDKNGNRVDKWDPKDQIVVGDAMEKYRGNIGINFDYKGIIFNALMSFRFGGQAYNYTLVNKVENLDIQYNVDKRAYTDSWKEIGQQAKYKQITDPNYFTNPTSRFVFDLNELKMTNLSLGYDFRNSDFIKNNKNISSLKVILNSNNVFTISNIEQERGTLYPFSRSIIFSIQATF